MRVTRLKAENFQGLKMVEVRVGPDLTEIEIGGKNAQGKSSLLNALETLLAGAKSAPKRPVRNGAEKAVIEGEILSADGQTKLHLKKTITEAGNTTFTVSDATGTLRSPQALMDKLLGEGGVITLEPLEFIQQKPKDQFKTLKSLAGIDFTDLEEEHKRVYEERTGFNAVRDQLKARGTSIRQELGDVEIPESEVDVSALEQELEDASAYTAKLTSLRAAVSNVESSIENSKRRIEALRRELADAEEHHTELEMRHVSATDELNALPDPASSRTSAEIREALAEAREQNALFHKGRALVELREQHAANEVKRVGAETRLDEIAAEKARRIAEAKFPVPGLTLGDDETVLYNGTPLADCCTAEQIRVSVAVGLAMQGALKIVRLTNGSLLDDDNRRIIREACEAAGAQEWVEIVGTGGPTTIVIEAGMVVDKDQLLLEEADAESAG